jgi:predicted amidohydrolase
MKDIITISAVNFDPVWGDSANNLKRILEHVETAAKGGSDLIIFPETALTGYDDDEGKLLEEKMHRRLAETVPGHSSNAIAELTKKYKVYVVYGLAERDMNDASKVYNAAAICGPEGIIGVCRKIHLPFSEKNWAVRGENPTIFNSPWGPIGVGICYDVYAFPEITRYARAMGARLFINCTAIGTSESGGAGGYTGNCSLEYHAHTNDMFIASSNMYGKDVRTYFMGGSSIIGPSSKPPHIFYYAGKPFEEKEADEGTIAKATIDLSIVRKSFLDGMWTNPDWRPDIYKQWFENVLKTDFIKLSE